jgi:DNA repair exonuclease SbcCD nuclease subunit
MSYFRGSKVAIFSDIHIGVHKNSKFWHDISKDWAKWFISEVKRHEIQDIVFCGDFFHFRDEVSVDTLHFASDLLDMFSDFNVIMITGNHDCYLRDSSQINSLSPFRNWKNVTIVENLQTIENNNKKYTFVPWGTEVDNIPVSDVIFGHFEINLFKMNTFFLCEDGIEPKDLLKKSPLVFSGHFHLRDERKYKNGSIVYVGNPFEMDYNDSGSSKGYYTLDLNTHKYDFYENLNSPKHNNISLSFLISEKTINENVKNLFANNLVKLKIDRRISSEDIEFLINKLKTLKPIEFLVEYENDISEYNMPENRKDFSGIDIEQAIIEFIDLMDINNKQELINYTIDLYRKSKN